ncbi:MAG: phosphoribosylanthranilate isomerase [Deltaproteobacteria bacterium]|nr:MAG: phosphoribosylanthranilate isomerase [Deltaproteobacteria bacterium]
MLIKVCGIRSHDQVEACREAAVDLIGLNLVPGARRAISRATARALVAAIDGPMRLAREDSHRFGSGRPRAVLLTRDAPLSTVLEDLHATGACIAQLHGEESPADCAEVRRRAKVIKALPAPSALARAPSYREVVDAFLIDGVEPGSGQRWAEPAIVGPRLCGLPLILAGGLHPGNVVQAIAQSRPAGVDVASGIERDGQPCPSLIAAFCEAARTSGVPA